jgi:outer membrane protein assembly factor BamB
MPVQTNTNLQGYLAQGLAGVSEFWSYKTKNWVTCVCSGDINNDGEIEIVIGSRDGRVKALTKHGDVRWERIIGNKNWVGTVAIIPQYRSAEGKDGPMRVIVGTRDGLVYVLDKDGKTIGKAGERYSFAKDGRALDTHEVEAFWFQSEHVIREVIVSPEKSTDIFIASEDRHVYLLDLESGTVRWKFATNGWIRALYACDINDDGVVETLLGSKDKYIYVIDRDGNCLEKQRMEHSIYTLAAADIDDDGKIEILVGTDGKELIALTAHLERKWRQIFENRLLSLYVTTLDGGCKLIAGNEDKHIYFLDGKGKTIWRHQIASRVFSVSASDIDNDGQREVLVGAEDNSVHVFRVRLVKDLIRKIRRNYQTIGKPPLSTLTTLSHAERALLQDLLDEEVKEHETLKQVTLKHVEHLIDHCDYVHALSDLLRLQQQKVQVLWRKDDYGHIRSLCFGDISGDSRREVIVGTSEGTLHAFTNGGRLLWTKPLGEEILSVQTGYMDRGRWEEIVVCSSDHHIYIVSGVSGMKGQIRQEPQIKHAPYMDEWMTDFHVLAGSKQGAVEVVIGSADKKIYLYGRDLTTPSNVFETPQGIKTIYAYIHEEGEIPQIVAGSLKNTVYAYTRSGTQLWQYNTRDRIRAVCVKDIDGDGQVEIVIGSEDRNVYVLDSKGHLKWRYYLAHSVLAIDAIDADADGKVEIFLGCADGNLYVLSRDGEFLWKYWATDRIRVVKVEDIDGDENVEIALGADDQLEVLQVVDQRQVRQLIDQCWLALQKECPVREVISMLLEQPEAHVRAFALQKLAERAYFDLKTFEIFEAFSQDDAVDVRKALIRAIITCYARAPQQAKRLLTQLSVDPHEEVRLVIVDQIQSLITHDWETGFEYLEGFAQSSNRFVRRMVLHQLHFLVDRSNAPYKEIILRQLLKAARDTESDWVKQEAARTLAHFMDQYPGDLLVNLFRCITAGIDTEILRHILYNAKTPVVQHVFSAFVPLMDNLNDTNALERIEYTVGVLEEVKSLRNGNETCLIYEEFRRLLRICTISAVADYHTHLDANEFVPENIHASIILRICQRLSIVTRLLRIYLKREGINDRLSSLLEASSTIENIAKFAAREYATIFSDSARERLPDYQFFTLLFHRWDEIISTQLRELRGRAELRADLKTRNVPHEEQIGIWLMISNTGRSAANNVKISLLHNGEFDIVGRNSFETEVIFAQEEAHAEFSIRPHTVAKMLVLNFEIIYDDAEAVMKTLIKGEQLELEMKRSEFVLIPNPYSTGTPTHNSKMFFGREKDIEFLKDNLTRPEAKTIIVLYGQRRSGKTTLLLHLVNTPALGRHIPILLDMQKESYRISINTFFHNLAFYIFKEFRKRGIVIEKPASKEFERQATFAFDQFLDEAEAKLTDQKIIVFIDEFEILETQVKKGTLDPEVFEYLRSLMQHHTNINFLLSGTHKMEELTRGYWSVFFNIALHYRLSPLSQQSAIGLITNPVAGYLEYEPYAVYKILDLTANQPYLIHLICRLLVDHCNEKRKTCATINDVNIVLQEVMETGQSYFDWLWDQIGLEEHIVLSVLAEGGRGDGRALPLVEIEEIYRHYHILFKREQVVASLKELMAMDVIEKLADDLREHPFDGARFRIAVGLIRQWLLKEKNLEQVLQEKEVFQ